MQVDVLPAEKLTAEQTAAWSRIQRSDSALASPYFRPEFTQSVAKSCRNAEVAVFAEGGEPVAFFPFQRTVLNSGRPIGGALSDFHGVIAERGFQIPGEKLIDHCGLRSWHFDHLPVEQHAFAPSSYKVEPSLYLDLTPGFDAYCKERKAAGSQLLKHVGRKARQLESAVGPLRFEAHSHNREILQTLIDWKIEQYLRTGVLNVFGPTWTVELVEHIFNQKEDSFCGMMSVLYAGDEIAAIDLGLRSHDVLHSWFPAYNAKFAKYSCGHILLLETARAAESLGIRQIHLGKGSEDYKRRYASSAVLVAEGYASSCRTTRMARKLLHGTREWLQNSRLRTPARYSARLIRPVRQWMKFGS